MEYVGDKGSEKGGWVDGKKCLQVIGTLAFFLLLQIFTRSELYSSLKNTTMKKCPNC